MQKEGFDGLSLTEGLFFRGGFFNRRKNPGTAPFRIGVKCSGIFCELKWYTKKTGKTLPDILKILIAGKDLIFLFLNPDKSGSFGKFAQGMGSYISASRANSA